MSESRDTAHIPEFSSHPLPEVVSREVLLQKIQKLYETPNAVVGILFAGDRIRVCDEGVIMEDKETLVGVATIAPDGEDDSGQPTIVGLYVDPNYRHSGYGKQILQKAVERCVERGFDNIRIDSMSQGTMKIIEKLPEHLKAKLDVHDLGDLMDRF